MATLNDALDSIERHIGFPRSRSNGVARRLQEANALPLGAPGVAPELDVDDFIVLVVALAADTTLHGAPTAVVTYLGLTPAGADMSDAPASVPRSAGDALIRWTDQALHGDADVLRRDRITVVSTWSEIEIAADGKLHRFREQGALATTWEHSGHRKAVTLSGAALVDALTELFQRKN